MAIVPTKNHPNNVFISLHGPLNNVYSADNKQSNLLSRVWLLPSQSVWKTPLSHIAVMNGWANNIHHGINNVGSVGKHLGGQFDSSLFFYIVENVFLLLKRDTCPSVEGVRLCSSNSMERGGLAVHEKFNRRFIPPRFLSRNQRFSKPHFTVDISNYDSSTLSWANN